jgi:uncharacterized protein (DUF2252 family)
MGAARRLFTEAAAAGHGGTPVRVDAKPSRLARKPGAASTGAPERSRAELHAMGKQLRASCPRSSHAAWKAPSGRKDPVQLVLEAGQGRAAELLPLRHGRMVRSPFTFYRGGALTMAADLASTPSTGVYVQACGDAHLCNFGGFASSQRRVIFSINDLDETLPAPWEWDLKRLGASFAVAGRGNGLKDTDARDVVTTCVRSYREAMAELGQLKALEVWNRSLGMDDLVGSLEDPAARDQTVEHLRTVRGVDELVGAIEDSALRQRAVQVLRRARVKSNAEDIFPKQTVLKGGRPVIKDEPPTVFHPEGYTPGKVPPALVKLVAGYRATLTSSYQSLLDQFRLRDAAFKVVGVGSVGTACGVLLFMAGEDDPLFLQFKEARASVLAPHAGASAFPNEGQRVVHGHRIMQSSSDVFLGWARGPRCDYYFRQLRDIKVSLDVATFELSAMQLYAAWCGKALALSHARSGSSAMLSGYMGKSDVFDEAITSFSLAYADQNEKDHAAFARAVKAGRVKAVIEEAS